MRIFVEYFSFESERLCVGRNWRSEVLNMEAVDSVLSTSLYAEDGLGRHSPVGAM